MAERGTSQNVPNDLLVQMVAALHQMNESLHNMNQNPTPSPSSQPLVPPEPVEYRGLNEFCKRNPSQFHGGFAPDAALEWIQGMERIFRSMNCSEVHKLTYATYMLVKEAENWWEFTRRQMEADGQLVSWSTFKAKFLHKYFPADLKRKKEMEFVKLEQGSMSNVRGQFEGGRVGYARKNFPRDFGPQCNHMRERGKERVEDDRKPYAATIRHRDRNFQRSRTFTVPTEGVSTPMCNKCGRRHLGSTCPGSGNGCFHCKESGHIKRFCPKLDQRPNIIPAEEARDHDQMVTSSSAGISGVDDLASGKSHGNSCTHEPSVLGVDVDVDVSIYGWGKWQNLYNSVDMRNDVPMD
ncbi:hypothetical protein Lal_00008517 [Lupinus albus]|nr:hypothetical protein Lal_00008517 [Lupinus albus]